MPEHSVITDPNIHEPKGVASANAGEVYIANGSGSGAWDSPLPDQSGNAGKVLTTDGTTASWADSSVAGGRVLARATVIGTTVSNSYNVASCSQGGTSTYTITFSTPIGHTNYQMFIQIDAPGVVTDKVALNTSKSSGSCSFTTYRASNAAAAAIGSFDIVIFG